MNTCILKNSLQFHSYLIFSFQTDVKPENGKNTIEPPLIPVANEESTDNVERTSKLFLEALQYITQKQVQETLAPLLKTFTFKQVIYSNH